MGSRGTGAGGVKVAARGPECAATGGAASLDSSELLLVTKATGLPSIVTNVLRLSVIVPL